MSNLTAVGECRGRLSRALLSTCALMPLAVCFGLSQPSLAQSNSSNAPALPASVQVRAADENGVDMYNASISFSVADVAIGNMGHVVNSLNPPDHIRSPLAFNRATGLMDNYQAVVVNPGCPSGSCTPVFEVGTGASTDRFMLNTANGGFKIGTGGAQLISDPTSADPNCAGTATVSCRDWLYVEKDGTAVSLTNSGVTGAPSVISKIVHPDGLVEQVTHATSMRDLGPADTSNTPSAAVPFQMGYPVLAVNRSDGLQLKYKYGSNWDLQGVVALNNAYEYCDPTAATCTPSQAWPTSGYGWSASSAGADTVLSVTDSAGRSTRYTLDNFGRVRSLKPATSASDVSSFDYCLRRFEYNPEATGPRDPHACFYYKSTYQSGGTSTIYVEDRVLSVGRDGQTWTYGYPVEGSTIYSNELPSALPIIATRPDGHQTIANQSLNPTYLTDYSGPGVYGTFEQNLANRLSTAWSWAKGGVSYHYTYDDRGNILSDGITSAGYDTMCQNFKTCNQPNWTRDANNNQTDYTYDSQHGGVLTKTLPADPNGIRPQVRYSYVQRYAWFLNGTGQMVRSTTPIWKLASQSRCQNGAAAVGGGCASPGDEVLTTYDYGPDAGPNNLWLRGMTVAAGGVSRLACYTYDKAGHQLTVTSPRANLTSCS